MKPVSVSSWRMPAARAIEASSRDETIELAKTSRAVDPAGHEVGAEQGAHLVAAQHPPVAGGRVEDRGGAPVGVGVVGDDEVAPHLAGPGEGEVDRALLLGVGEGDGREVGVGHGLLVDGDRRREAGPDEGLVHRAVADAVQARVHDRQVAGGVRVDDRDDGVEVVGQEPLAERLPPLVRRAARR